MKKNSSNHIHDNDLELYKNHCIARKVACRGMVSQNSVVCFGVAVSFSEWKLCPPPSGHHSIPKSVWERVPPAHTTLSCHYMPHHDGFSKTRQDLSQINMAKIMGLLFCHFNSDDFEICQYSVAISGHFLGTRRVR
jgi:hypothetical protein